MRKNIFIHLLLALSTSSAWAAEEGAGTIHFTGEIIAPSCVIAGDSGTDYNVLLGSYPPSFFTAPGIETDTVPVTITLNDCPMASDGLSTIHLSFTGQTVASNQSLLKVSKITTDGTTAADGVGIALSPEDSTATLIKLDGTDETVAIDLPSTTGDSTSVALLARYKSFADTVTAGPADADLTINIRYR